LRSSGRRASWNSRSCCSVSALQPVSIPPTTTRTDQEHDYNQDPEKLIVHIFIAVQFNEKAAYYTTHCDYY